MSTLASPTNISGATGTAGGATGDWLAWTCPATGYYRFDTRTNPGFRSSLNGYLLSATPHSPVIMADLTLLTYVASGNEPANYGYEWGALIAFSATSGDTYYFNVTSRDGSSGAFTLTWTGFSFVTLGPCGQCTPESTGLCFVKSAGISAIAGDIPYSSYKYVFGSYAAWTEGTADFGTVGSGYYYLLYCGGAMQSSALYEWCIGLGGGAGGAVLFGSAATNYVGVFWDGETFGSPSSGASYSAGNVVNFAGTFYRALHNVTISGSGSYPPNDSTNWVALTSPDVLQISDSTGSYTLPTQQAAEMNSACLNWPFCFAGGDIKLVWMFGNQFAGANDYIDGSPDTTLALFRFDPGYLITGTLQSISNGGASGSGYNYSVTIKLTNTSLRFASGPFSVALQSGGPSSLGSVSAAVNVSSIAAGGSATATFTFYSAAEDALYGVFQMSDCNGNANGPAFQLTLATAAISMSVTTPNTVFRCSSTCSNLCQYSPQLTINNVGVVPISAVNFTITLSLGGLFTTDIQDTTGQGSAPDSSICAKSFSSPSLNDSTGALAVGSYIYVHFGAQRSSSVASGFQNLIVDSTINGVAQPAFTQSLQFL